MFLIFKKSFHNINIKSETFFVFSYILYFSEVGSEKALERAKWNLVNHYLIVGLTERMEDMVAILEHLLPNFFFGAFSHFQALNGMCFAVFLDKIQQKIFWGQIPCAGQMTIGSSRMSIKILFTTLARHHEWH